MEQKKGNLLILTSAILFSLGGLCIKMIPWSGMAINGGRSLISCVILFTFLRLTKQRIYVTKGTIIGAFCIFGTTLLYSIANTITTAANSILLQFVAPVFIILFMWLFFKERPRKLDVITCLVVFGGITCFVLDGLGTGHLLGDFLALASGVCYAGVFMMNRLPGGDSFSATFLGHLTGGLVGIPFIFREQDFSATPLTFLIILGVFQLGLGYLCLCIGIKKTPPVTAALISGIEPILNPLLVAIFVGEMISPISALGGVLVIGAITTYNVLLAKRQPAPTPDQPLQEATQEVIST
jgi:drug/metabolite transporter (DMT)-like permease